MTNAWYLAYFELHEIPWKQADAVKLIRNSDGAQFQIGRGPYKVPDMAVPDVTTRAGGALIQMRGPEVHTIEGGHYFGVALPVEYPWQSGGPLDPRWDALVQEAEDAAAVVSFCLKQRFAPRRIADFIRREAMHDGSGPAMAV